MRGRPGVAWGEALILGGIVALAAVLRLVSLPTRGAWDADQGEHLLVVRAMVSEGRIPLVGPVTSFGGVHHGALYYDLLAPAAWISGTDPTIVVLTIVLAGIGAVAATWWLGRLLGGPLAGAIAGGIMAASATEVGASTFIWNPTLLPLGGSLVFAGAAWAWLARRPAGWLVAAVGSLIAMQAHLLGALLLPPLVALYALDVRRTRRATRHRAASRRLALAGAGAAAIVVVGHTQLIANELTTGFSETRAFVGYLGAAGGGSETGPLVRLVLVALRILSWPFTGLFVDAYAAALVVAGVVVGLLGWRLLISRGAHRAILAWFAATIAWCWVGLALLVPSLSTVVRELPVDHYHAFLDPLVVAIVAVGAGALLEAARPGPRVAAGIVVAGIVAWNLATQPPLVAPDGGWPAAQRAADRVEAATKGGAISVVELPSFKGPEAYTFPLVRDGTSIVPRPADLPAGGYLAVVCEDAFREAIGRACDGPAEDAAAAAAARSPRLVERFLAAPGRHLSLYRVGP